jgi:DNA-binding protein HU-beta
MIKIDIADKLVNVYPSFNRSMAIQVVDLITEQMKDTLLQGDRIELRGFGVFEVRARKTGTARNIKAGTQVEIPKGRSIRFKPGKEIRSIEVE